MGRRGDQLRDHILWTAKDVFLELGFERASMDVVAARAETSKRTLYAHFESKENLFLAVIDHVRGLVLGRLGVPGDGSEDPVEALTRFCARYLDVLLYEPSIQMCRVSIAETARFPQGAAQHFDVVFTEVQSRLSSYLQTAFWVSARTGDEATERLLGGLLYPRLIRALFGLDKLAKSFDREASSPTIDPGPIRSAVAAMIASLPAPEEARRSDTPP